MGKPSKATLSKAGRTLATKFIEQVGQEQGRVDPRQRLTSATLRCPAPPSAGAGHLEKWAIRLATGKRRDPSLSQRGVTSRLEPSSYDETFGATLGNRCSHD